MDETSAEECLSRIDDLDAARTTFGVIFAVSASVALTLLILVTITIKRVKHLKQLSIYTLIIFLNITQIIYQLPVIIILLPCTFTTCEFYSDIAILVLSWPETFGFYSTAAINCFIAAERISIFHLEPVHNFINRYTILCCLMCWIFGAFVVVFTTAFGCYKRFNPYAIRFSYECSNCVLFGIVDIRNLLSIVSHIAVFVMILGYIVLTITVKIKMRRNPDEGNNIFSQEVQLVIQGFFICFFQWLDSLAFFITPLLGTTRIAALANGMILILNGGIQPIVLLIFNKTIRNRFVAYFVPKKTKIYQREMLEPSATVADS